MRLLSAISIAVFALSGVWFGKGYTGLTQTQTTEKKTETTQSANSDFEKAVEMIKRYETLNSPKHWPYVGYGHRVLPGEKFSRTKALSEKEADAILRKDLLKNCAVFRSFGADSLLLATLAYNIGPGATMKSSVVKKLKAGDRNIYENYIAHSRYKGKTHAQIKRRRIEEFETLFVRDPMAGNENQEVEKTEVLNETETLARATGVWELPTDWNLVARMVADELHQSRV